MSLLIEGDMAKACSSCGYVKPLDSFYRHESGKFGRHSQCKDCTREFRRADANRRRAYTRAYRAANPHRALTYNLKQRYRITADEYEALLDQQGGCCAICGSEKAGGRGQRFHVDHCHRTGRIRGLLCYGCNVGLGWYEKMSANPVVPEYLRGPTSRSVC